MPTIVGVLNESVSSQEVLLTFNTVVYLRDYKGYDFDLSQIQLRAKAGESSRRIGYLSGKDNL